MMICYFSKRNFSITDNDIIDNRILPKGDFTVTSSNNSVATVRKETMGNGEWNGFSVFTSNAGSSTITVKIGNVSRSFKVTVTDKTVPATGLTLTPERLEFVEGQTKSIRATVTPSNSTDEVVWSNHFLFENKGGGLALSARVVTFYKQKTAYEIEALQDNGGEFLSVGIDGSGGLKKSFYVSLKK